MKLLQFSSETPSERIRSLQHVQNTLFSAMKTLAAKPRVIQLSAPDLTYEWDVRNNILFLTKGIREKLHLGPAPVISREEFTKHIPVENSEARENVLREMLTGNSIAIQELVYPFDSVILHSYLFVVHREANGAARTIIGNVSIQEEVSYTPSYSCDDKILLHGFLRYDVGNRAITLDSNCAALLGYEETTPKNISLLEFRAMVNPEDLNGLVLRAQLIFEHNQWGNDFEDILRLRRQDGTEARFLLHISILARNERRQATEVVGSLRIVDEFTHPVRNTNLIQAISASGDGLWDWDVVHNTVSYSPRYLSMLGYTPEEFPAVPESWMNSIHPDDVERTVSMQLLVIDSPQNGDSFECSYRMRRADGTYAWILGRGYVSHRDANGKATRLVGLHTDITTPQGNRARLEDAVNTDSLTGAHSRWYFNSEVQRVEQAHIRPASILVFDLDGLKLVNDYLGHDCGDRMIREFAALLRQNVRSSDCVARMGGDEFAILLHRCPKGKAREIMENIAKDVARHNLHPDAIPLHVSMAASTASCMDTTLLDTIVDADKEMLRYKHLRRKTTLKSIKDYIERYTCQLVTLDIERYQGNLADK